MEDTQSVKRVYECRIKLTQGMYSRLEALAEANGFPVATMGAVAVGEWVNSKEIAQKNQRMMLMDISRQMGGDVAKLFESFADSPQALAEAEAIAKGLLGANKSVTGALGASGG
jgi:hypothetical protein